MTSFLLPSQIDQIPHKSGCYQYFDDQKKLIYVGKAKDLRKRVSQYFHREHDDAKTAVLVDQIAFIDYIITQTEVEALLLESRMVRQYKPKYNIDLKENDRYAYITITDEDVPRLMTARRKGDGGAYYGPFVDGYARALTVKVLNETFQLRTCKVLPDKVCLNYHIGLCCGPCENKVTMPEYESRIERAKSYLKGHGQELVLKLRSEMAQFAKSQQFELAKLRRDQIHALESLQVRQIVDKDKEFDQDVIGLSRLGKTVQYFIFNIVRGTINKKEEFEVVIPDFMELQTANKDFLMQYYATRVPPKEIIFSEDFLQLDDRDIVEQALSSCVTYQVRLCNPKQGDNAKLLALATTNADYSAAGDNPILLSLKDRLHLPTVPYNIECFDISNLGNDYIVGAKVHFTNGAPNTSQYRRYRIKWQKEQNDFAAMFEVTKRRFAHALDGSEPLPDLVVIDGGRGQLHAALDALRDLGLRVPIIGLAKREEEIYFPGMSKPLSTAKAKDEAVRLLMRIRDETHRFVITYHRKLRDTIKEE